MLVVQLVVICMFNPSLLGFIVILKIISISFKEGGECAEIDSEGADMAHVVCMVCVISYQ